MGLARGLGALAGMAVALSGVGSSRIPAADAGGAYRWTVERPIRFDAGASLRVRGSGAAYAWDFGDGSRAEGPVASHAYAAPGAYVVTLTVSEDGARAVDRARVTVLRAGAESRVTWEPGPGAADEGGRLAKTAATPGWDASAASSEALEGDGYLEFTAKEADTRRLAGLGARGAGTPEQVELGVLLREDGTAQAQERGVPVGPAVAYRAGDRFRVSIDAGVARYIHNGRVLRAVLALAPRARADLAAEPDPGWRLAGAGDFNGDGSADLLWRHASLGHNRVWYLEGRERAGSGDIDPEPDPDWRIAGVADFDGDGRPDLLWHHAPRGEARVWLMKGVARADEWALPEETEHGWLIEGAADFDGDGRADVLWRHPKLAQRRVWVLRGSEPARTVPLDGARDQGWGFLGSAQFVEDGQPGILWRDSAAGTAHLWSMEDGQVADRVELRLDPAPEAGWEIAAAADFDGDGRADLLWRQPATGALQLRFPAERPARVLRARALLWTPGATVVDAVIAKGGAGDAGPAANHPPVVSVTVTPAQCHIPCTATFTATASDPDGDPLNYVWHGCAVGQTGPIATCPMTFATVYIGRVTVFDPAGAFATGWASANGTNQLPTVAVTGDSSCHPPCVGRFQATGSDPDGDPLTFLWGGCAAGQVGTQATCALASVPISPPPLHKPVATVVVASFAALAGYVPSCNSTAAAGGAECRVAINRFCDARPGYAGGYGPVELTGTDAYVVCLADEFAALRLTTFTQLAQHHSACSSEAVGFSSACATASYRYCRAQGYGSGLGPQEYLHQNAMPFCSGAVVSQEIPTTFPELRTHYPDCFGTSANSLGCRVAIDRFCRARGFAGGFGPTEFDPPGASVTCLPAEVVVAPVTVSVTADDGRGGQATALTSLNATNAAPAAPTVTPSPAACVAPCSVSFTAAATDPDGDAVAFMWGGCAVGSAGATAICAASSAGAVIATVTVSDGRGGQSSGQGQATAQPPPAGQNLPPVAVAGGPYPGVATKQVTLDGRASRDPENRPLTYNWTFGDSTTGTGPTPVHAYASAGTFTATLTVRDEGGLTSTDTAVVNVAPLDDPDGDGLTTAQEQTLGSNPNRADTNGDGIPDGAALGLGLSLTNMDMDGEGVLNAVEITNGTDPFKADTDGDGASDFVDRFPLDPTLQNPPPNPNDHTPPSIQLTKPEGAVPIGPPPDR